MQADRAFIAFLTSGSWITSVLMPLFIVSMPAIEVANWASLNSATMLAHLPAAACAAAGRLAGGPAGPPRESDAVATVKPYCTASAGPREAPGPEARADPMPRVARPPDGRLPGRWPQPPRFVD